VTAGDSLYFAREERAFYNAASDPHVFPTDSFIGRDKELSALRESIDSTPSRITGIVGPAGVGKTRLAMEALRTVDERYPGGAVIVRLAAIERVSDIIPEIARALGMIDQAEKLDELVREALAEEPAVLLLDNFEHLTPAADEIVAGLRDDCPGLRIVLTTRRPSTLPGVRRFELAPLATATGKSAEAALRSDAVRLFIDRAGKARRRGFNLWKGDAEIINALCARYDGLPLAIELMASWVTTETPRDLLNWKPEQLAYRTPVDDPRHQSLFDAIAWSFEHLSPDEQQLLLRLSIFSGGFSSDLVEKMVRGREAGAGYPYCDGYNIRWFFDLEGLGNPTEQPQDPDFALALAPIATGRSRPLATLIDHRLVYQSGEIDGVPRFDVFEAVREFGLYHLAKNGQLEAVRHAHAATMVAFAEAACEGFWREVYRLFSRERVDAELQNIRSAQLWASSHGDAAAEIGLRMTGPLWNYWQTRGLITEGRAYIDDWIFRPTQKEWSRITNLPGLAFLCWIQGDDDRCQEVVDAALAEPSVHRFFSSEAMVYLVKALLEFRRGLENVVTMMEYVENADRLFSRGDDDNGKGACYLIYGQVFRLTGDTKQALQFFDDARDLLSETGYEWGVATSRYFAGEVTRDLAETDPSFIPKAVALLNEALDLFWTQGDFWGAGGAMSGLACVLTMQGVDTQAAEYFGAAQVLMGRVGGSLLPSELMTHQETEAELQARMAPAEWQRAFALGQEAPDRIVERALADAAHATPPGSVAPPPKLTRIQTSIVQDLVQGYDVTRIAQRRGRSLSATYEAVDRILVKLGLTEREAIAPYAVKTGLVKAPNARPGFNPQK
jgi:non-specific serine/threonine protein kinase